MSVVNLKSYQPTLANAAVMNFFHFFSGKSSMIGFSLCHPVTVIEMVSHDSHAPSLSKLRERASSKGSIERPPKKCNLAVRVEDIGHLSTQNNAFAAAEFM